MSHNELKRQRRQDRRARGECAFCGEPDTPGYRCERCKSQEKRRAAAPVSAERATDRVGLSWAEVAMIYEYKHGKPMTETNAQMIGSKAIERLRLDFGEALLAVA